jgi:hypothetical protein
MSLHPQRILVSKFRNFKIYQFQIHLNSTHSQASYISNMESDCKDKDAASVKKESSSIQDDILKILSAISSQMMMNHQDVQDQLIPHDLKPNAALQKVVYDNEVFKQEVCEELCNLQTELSSSNTTPASKLKCASSIQINKDPTHSGSSVVLNATPVSPCQSTNTMDFQDQTLVMSNDTFSKLSTVITDNKNDFKSEWLKCSGDSKKFCSWYLAIMAQLSFHPWQELYDSTGFPDYKHLVER